MAHRRSVDSMRRLYNWFYRFYPLIEKSIEPTHDRIMRTISPFFTQIRNKTAIDYACGTGSLAVLLASYFGAVDGRDLSPAMLGRARKKAAQSGKSIRFDVGNILEIKEPDRSFNYVFVSFALHLFSPEKIGEILVNLTIVSREKVIIIDHPRTWDVFTAFMEWIEGSY
jgi:ubiquinone/menaquinone biosynthesis C-methylase UbiE